MSRIDHLNDILSIVRRKVEETGRARAPSSPKNTSPKARTSARVGANELERRVVERIKKIPADERDFAKKAGRIFVDAVMAWEFGEELLLDAEYDDMAHDVLTMMLEHDETRQIMETLFRGSVSKSPPR